MPFVPCLDPGRSYSCCYFVDGTLVVLFLSVCKTARFFGGAVVSSYGLSFHIYLDS